MTTTKYVAYYRVSTDKQGIVGLGMDAQRHIVAQFIQPGDTIIGAYTEVESGKKNNRPELTKALAHARLGKATLIIAKLDRLARNVAFIANLMESKVPFVACDMPHADAFRLHIEAAVAQDESRRISERTKAALAQAKARGVVMGANSQALKIKYQAQAEATAKRLKPIVARLQAQGHTSVRKLAAALNDNNIPTPVGTNKWHATTVQRLLDRLKSNP